MVQHHYYVPNTLVGLQTRILTARGWVELVLDFLRYPHRFQNGDRNDETFWLHTAAGKHHHL